ncbi:glycoside hydrolase family 6 protein [Phaeosphaeria sp. MPI-PUGE-AT-0046c]|nr:glycoside hydrolase family 6 protein [Phaeosphaeria sp. MPI-PUGE-AT-0046c]
MWLLHALVGASALIDFRAFNTTACTTPVALNTSTNIWLNYTLNQNNIYRQKVGEAISNITDTAEGLKALHVAETGSFAWIEGPRYIKDIDQLADNVPCANIVGLVLSGLPFKTCTNLDLLPTDDSLYYSQAFINPIVAKIKARPNTAFAVILEPGVMEKYALDTTNACQHVRDSWHRNVPLALKALDLPNVITYLDGANGGVFGWTGRSWQGSATELTETWKAAGSLTQFRGLAVNVRGYNAWDLTPPERFKGENTCYDLYNKGRNEKRYLNYLYTAGLRVINSSMPFHNIMDTSRNGQLGLRENWSDWCNLNSAGIGLKPRAVTNEASIDAFVWASSPGVSDGTSDASSKNYQAECAGEVNFKPMPERGEVSMEYFRMMLSGCRGCAKVKARRRIEARCG